MITSVVNKTVTAFHQFKKDHPALYALAGFFILSWFYALCEQIAMPLPFGLVPMIIMPVPLYLLAFTLGMPAVYAYGLYLMQGALGAPFFAHGLGGIGRLLGPTGGYLLGMGIGAFLLALTCTIGKSSKIMTLAKITIANIILFTVGLFQLSFFVPQSKLLAAGLWPFVIGDFVIKAGMIMSGLALRRFYTQRNEK